MPALVTIAPYSQNKLLLPTGKVRPVVATVFYCSFQSSISAIPSVKESLKAYFRKCSAEHFKNSNVIFLSLFNFKNQKSNVYSNLLFDNLRIQDITPLQSLIYH
jgi:hypothetical protein